MNELLVLVLWFSTLALVISGSSFLLSMYIWIRVTKTWDSQYKINDLLAGEIVNLQTGGKSGKKKNS